MGRLHRRPDRQGRLCRHRRDADCRVAGAARWRTDGPSGSARHVLRKFDKSLAIIPNFQFAENAVINISETTNWRIDWAITLQYDTTVDQLKKIRNEIEDHIKKSDDFDKAVGIAVRIEKFSDSSIDMRVRCFTASNSFATWLEVKEKLAIEIKQIVEGNSAAFAFPSQSIYIEKK